ncbi:hypothetical protein BDF19DRAFT_449527 [Syncephalis fuscata]|nr:hypothetical protein BDF19DRAFT_449527 [Syncephalis fuscata]
MSYLKFVDLLTDLLSVDFDSIRSLYCHTHYKIITGIHILGFVCLYQFISFYIPIHAAFCKTTSGLNI